MDIWALGVTCYELVTGWFPFDGADKAEIKKAILDHRMRPFPGQGLSPQAISFIKAMLSPHPDARPSAEALMNHVFVQSHLHGTPLLKAPTRRGVALQVRAGPPAKPDKQGTCHVGVCIVELLGLLYWWLALLPCTVCSILCMPCMLQNGVWHNVGVFVFRHTVVEALHATA